MAGAESLASVLSPLTTSDEVVWAAAAIGGGVQSYCPEHLDEMLRRSGSGGFFLHLFLREEPNAQHHNERDEEDDSPPDPIGTLLVGHCLSFPEIQKNSMV